MSLNKNDVVSVEGDEATIVGFRTAGLVDVRFSDEANVVYIVHKDMISVPVVAEVDSTTAIAEFIAGNGVVEA